MKDMLKNTNNAEKLLKLTSDTLILLDKDGICVDINVCNIELWFLKEETLRGKNLLKLIPTATYHELYPEFKKVLTNGVRSTRNYELKLGSKTYFFKCIMQPYEDWVLCQYRDITERSQRKLELEKNNFELQEIQKAALIGKWRYDSENACFHYVGHTGIMCTGEEQEIHIDDYARRILPEDREMFHHWLRQSLQGNLEESIDYRIQFEQETFYIRLKAFTCEKHKNGATRLEGYIQNITQRIKGEQDIKRFSQILDKTIENLPAGIIVKDIENGFKYLYRNKESYNRSIPMMDALGKDDFDYHPLEVAREKRQQDIEVAETGIEKHWIIEERDQNGRSIYLDKRKIRIDSKDFTPILLSIEWDITEVELMKRELLIAKEKAETSDQLKSAFLANMSHEIRTPLNAIVGFSRIIAESNDAEERKNFYDIVEANNDRLLQLINEILDLSKIEAGIVEFTIAPVRLHPLCREIYDALKFRCPQGVELIYNASQEDVVIQADKNRIFQVISNLISNAFKFTTSGSISYGYRCGNNEIECYVSDTGIGIEADKLDKVFERFVKVNTFAQGTGLGLSICRTIIERLGGTISVSSEFGKGTTFTFTLPLCNAGTEQATAANIAGAAHPHTAIGEKAEATTKDNRERSISEEIKKEENTSEQREKIILVAEDTDSNYILTKAILGQTYRLEHAKDGMEAVSMFEELQPDLILMDMKMPNLDGLDATQIIRQLSPEVPIIALTAYAYEHDKQAAFKAGCNDFLAKPFTQEVLKEMIRKYVE